MNFTQHLIIYKWFYNANECFISFKPTNSQRILRKEKKKTFDFYEDLLGRRKKIEILTYKCLEGNMRNEKLRKLNFQREEIGILFLKYFFSFSFKNSLLFVLLLYNVIINTSLKKLWKKWEIKKSRNVTNLTSHILQRMMIWWPQ